MRALHWPDVNFCYRARERWTERVELAGVEIAQRCHSILCGHTEFVTGTLHVDIEASAAYQFIQQLGGAILVQLRQALRRRHQALPALAAACGNIDNSTGCFRAA